MNGCKYLVGEGTNIDKCNFYLSYNVKYYCTKNGSYDRTTKEHCNRCPRNKGFFKSN